MFNTYTSSVLWPIRSRNYLDYCSLLPERSETYQFSKASISSRFCSANSCSRSRCWCCSTPSSSLVKPKVSINAGIVIYGLRKSTLIQWPSFRRRLRFSVADWHCCDSEISSSCGGRRRNRGFRLRVSEECGRSFPDDAEAMVSFLSEELIDEERDLNSVSKIEERKKVRYGVEFHSGNVSRVKFEGRDTTGNGRVSCKNKEGLEIPGEFGSSSLIEQIEQQQPLSAKFEEEAGSALTDYTLIQNKLQRNKQVVRDSFEECEEAYIVEAEKRTVDEIFMRGALVEAKKAADTWEVPVGAVLVHDGKIIARGFNL